MAKITGKRKDAALLQISIKNITYLQENLSSTEFLDLLNKIYNKIKSIIIDKDAYLYKFTGKDFFIIMEDIKDDKIKQENTFYLTKEILDKLKKHNEFLKQHHIPEIEVSMALDYGEIIVGKVNFKESEKTVLTGIPFQNTQRAINLNERKNITPLLLTENIYDKVQHLLSEYIVSVMGYMKIENREIYLFGSYQFNK